MRLGGAFRCTDTVDGNEPIDSVPVAEQRLHTAQVTQTLFAYGADEDYFTDGAKVRASSLRMVSSARRTLPSLIRA